MVKLYAKIIVVLCFMFGSAAYSQFQNRQSMGGLDRSIGGDNRYKEPPKKEPVDYVKVMTDNLTTKLALDAFQSAVVKNLIADYMKRSEEILQQDIPDAAKAEKNKIERTAMESKFNEIFTEKQKILFKELTDKNSTSDKKKGKKKKNKDTETTEE